MKTIEFKDNALWILDQTLLPTETKVLECRKPEEVAEAITSLRVRGAPAIGLAAAYATVLAVRQLSTISMPTDMFHSALRAVIDQLRATRPTAVNLFWALDRMQRTADTYADAAPEALANILLALADQMLAEDEEANRAMGRHGADLIPHGANVLTHCNAGALATGAFGTALGVIRTAHEQGKQVHVWVDETRPLLQGARLTAWELRELGIPFTLITDNMAAHFMARGVIDLAMVGADRIVANGDAANKIGTYGVAVLAHAHNIPFYFVAPASTIDLDILSGEGIVIEERSQQEVTSFRGVRIAPTGTTAANPAFDVTPARLVTAIVSEYGVIRAPFVEGLARTASSSVRPVETLAAALSGDEAV